MVKEKRQRINRIATIPGVLCEMRSVYRHARLYYKGSEIDAQTAKVLTDILKTITQVYRDNELEQRIAAVEKQIGDSIKSTQ